MNAEELLLQAAKGQPLDSHLREFCTFYDFESGILAAQLQILHSAVTRQENDVLSVTDVDEALKKVPGLRILLNEVWRLTKLLLVVPASATTRQGGPQGEGAQCKSEGAL